MGIKESKAAEDQQLPKINHSKFAKSRWVNGQNKGAVQISLQISEERLFKAWQIELKNAPESKYFLHPSKYSYKQESCYCLNGQFGYLKIQFPTFQFILVDQIENRQQTGRKYFDESQVWYLTFVLLLLASLMHRNNKKVGDIRPENIFLSEDGEIKVPSTYSWPEEPNNYYKSLFQNQITYLAPEQINNIQLGQIKQITNLELAETFSIGLTLLDMSTLSNSNNIYKNKSRFDYSILETNLAKLQSTNYSSILKAVIRNMCQVQPNQRHTSIQLYNWLQPYSQFINKLEPFSIAQIPQKLFNNIKTSKDKFYEEEKNQSSVIKYSNQTPQTFMTNNQNLQKKQQKKQQKKDQILESSYYQVLNSQNLQQTIHDNWSKIDNQIQISKKMFP